MAAQAIGAARLGNPSGAMSRLEETAPLEDTDRYLEKGVSTAAIRNRQQPLFSLPCPT